MLVSCWRLLISGVLVNNVFVQLRPMWPNVVCIVIYKERVPRGFSQDIEESFMFKVFHTSVLDNKWAWARNFTLTHRVYEIVIAWLKMQISTCCITRITSINVLEVLVTLSYTGSLCDLIFEAESLAKRCKLLVRGSFCCEIFCHVHVKIPD